MNLSLAAAYYSSHFYHIAIIILVAALLAAGLVDELRLLVHPVVGAPGPRFFSDQLPLTGLTLVTSRPLALGVVALTCQPLAAPASAG